MESLVARNIYARGGAEAWEAVTSVRVAGEMDLGQEMVVPYVLEQKRPDKMCFEFIFDGKAFSSCFFNALCFEIDLFECWLFIFWHFISFLLHSTTSLINN